jgi:hypothetical protein
MSFKRDVSRVKMPVPCHVEPGIGLRKADLNIRPEKFSLSLCEEKALI